MNNTVSKRIVTKILESEVTVIPEKEKGTQAEEVSRKNNWEDFMGSVKVQLISSQEDFEKVIEQVCQAGLCGLDMETTGLDPHNDKAAYLQICIPEFPDKTQSLVNEEGTGPTEGAAAQVFLVKLYHLTDQERVQYLDRIVNVLEDEEVITVFHNASFDLKMARAGVRRRFLCTNIFDTMIASQLCTAGDFVPDHLWGKWCNEQFITVEKIGNKTRYLNHEGMPLDFEKNNQKYYKPYYHKHNLKEVCIRHLGIHMDKTLQASDWTKDLTPEMQHYMVMDVAVLLPLFEIFKAVIDDNRLTETAKREFDCIQATAEIEYNGMPFNVKKALLLLNDIQQSRQDIEHEVHEFIASLDEEGADRFNFNSNNHVMIVLKTLASLEQVLSEDGNSFVVDRGRPELLPISSKDDVISILATSLQEDSQLKFFIQQLKKYRKAKKEESFLKKYVESVHDKTERLHTSLRQLNPQGVGRLSAFSPSIQQVPRAKSFRELFSPKDDHKLIIADYSTIEMRIMAELSQDETLHQAFNDRVDVHTFTAANILGKSMDAVTKEERNSAKAFNFGLIYGMNAETLKNYAENNYRVKMTLQKAEEVREKFFELYQGICEWHKAQGERAFSQSFDDYAYHTYPEGYYIEQRPLTRTLGGRLRVWPVETKVSRYGNPYEAKVGPSTELYNTPSQGTGADIIKLAMYYFYEYLVTEEAMEVNLVGTVHDEIIVEAPDSFAEKVRDILEECMVKAGEYFLTVPVEVEASIATSWADK